MGINVQDIAFLRFTAPDLGVMEGFLTDFGMVRMIEHFTDGDLLDAAWGSRVTTVQDLMSSQWGCPRCRPRWADKES